jgi:hypothetical protein
MTAAMPTPTCFIAKPATQTTSATTPKRQCDETHPHGQSTSTINADSQVETWGVDDAGFWVCGRFGTQIAHYSLSYGRGVLCTSVRAFHLCSVVGAFHVAELDEDGASDRQIQDRRAAGRPRGGRHLDQ